MLFHVDSEDSFLLERVFLHSQSLERQVDQQKFCFGFFRLPCVAVRTVDDEHRDSAPFGHVGREAGSDFDVAESHKGVKGIGNHIVQLISVGHGILAFRSDDQIIDAVAIEVANELSKTGQHGAVFAELLLNEFVRNWLRERLRRRRR